MKGIRIITFFCLLVVQLYPIPSALNPAFAADSSPSASIQSKLKALQEEIASRAANMKNEVSKKLFNKAYIGVIKSKDSSHITVALKTNTGTIDVNEFTEYIIKSKTLTGDSGLKNLAVSDTIAALGDIDDKGTLTAKRIIKIVKPLPVKKIIYGALTTNATSSAVLKNYQDSQFSLTFDKSTNYQLGKSEGSLSDLQANTKVIIVSDQTNQETLLTRFAYIFPRGVNIKPKISTPTAKPKTP